MSEINSKTSFKVLKEYIKDNGFEKIYLEKHNKPYTKSKKEDLLKFIKEQDEIKQMEDNVDTIFGKTVDENSEFVNTNIIPDSNQNSDFNSGDKDPDLVDIEEIPVFSRSSKSGTNVLPIDDKLVKLNKYQIKVRKYINRFPEKLRSITSRSTFKQEFSKLKEPLSKEECDAILSNGGKQEDIDKQNEVGRFLLDDVEMVLNSKNSIGMVKEQVFVTISFIEDIIRYIRDNKDGKIPRYISDTIGNIRIDGLSAVLDARPEFHDCIDELLIKYDDYSSFLNCISVEKRLLLIILGAAVITHKINTENLDNLKCEQKKPIKPEFKDL